MMPPFGTDADDRPCLLSLSRTVLAALLSVLAFALFTCRIEAKGIWWDESLSLHRARGDVGYILSSRIEHPGTTSTDLHPPLYFLLLRAATQLCGESDLALRFPSAALATLTVPMVYAFGARVAGQRVGLLAGALAGASPFLLWYAQEARMYTMVTFLSAACLYALWRVLEEHRGGWGAAYVVLALGGLATHYLFALLVGAHMLLVGLLWFGSASAQRGRAGHGTDQGARPSSGLLALVLIALAGGIGVAVTAAVLFATRQAGRTYVPLGEMLADALHVFGLGASVPRKSAYWPLDGAFLAAYLLGVVALGARNPSPGAPNRAARWSRPAMLVVPLVVPLVGMWAYSRWMGPLYLGSRYIIMSAPCFYLGVGVGLDALWRRRWVAGMAALIVLLGAMAFSDYRYFRHPAYAAKEDHRAAAHLINEEGRPGDAILITAPENLEAFTHYYSGDLPIYPVPSVALTGASNPDRIETDLRAVLAGRYDRLWLVQSRTMFSDPKDLVTRWLDDHLLLLGRTTYPSAGSPVVVSTYLAEPPVSEGIAVGRPVGSFSDRLDLLRARIRYRASDGSEFSGDLSPGTEASEYSERSVMPVAPGQTMAVTLDWVAREPMVGHKASLRLVDASGHVWSQSDEALAPYFDVQTWPLGERLRHGQGLRVRSGMPPGTYTLRLVVYECQSGTPLSWAPDGGPEQPHVDLGKVVVGREERAPGVADVLPDHLSAALLPPRWDGLELLAWETAPDVVRDRLYVNLYWRARRPLREAYDLVVNWRDEEGNIWHSEHRHPAGVDYPTSAWRAGEVVWASLALGVPDSAPAGRHTVHLVLYAPEQERFPWLFRGPLPWIGRNLLIAEVTIE